MNHVRTPRPRLFTVLLVCALGLPAGASGQVQTADTTRVVPLGPVVVTAVRTPYVLRRVPYAVSVVGRDAIQSAKPGLGLDEALVAVPGVQVDNRYNYALGERISIRGFGARAAFGVRGVRVLLDGIPMTLPDGQTALSNVDVGALGRLEVVRGPASALYGNASGGVLRLETEAAFDVPLGQRFTAVGGEHGLLRLESTTGGRTSRDDYAIHVARLGYDGYRDYSRATNWYASGRYRHRGARSTWTLVASLADYDAENPGSLSESLLREDRSQAYAFNRLQRTREAGRQGQAGLRWERPVGPGALDVSGYGLARSIDNPIPPAIIDLDRLGGGLRALYQTNPLGRFAMRGAVGGSADVQFDDRRNYVNEEGGRGALTLDQREQVWNTAAFAQVGAAVTPGVDVLGSVRYDHFVFRADDALVDAGNPDDSGRRTMDAVSPSVGLTWNPADALGLFANVSTSFETPTTTELVNRPSGAGGFNAGVEPQSSRAVEVGVRGRVRSRLTYELAAYRAAVRNALIPYEVPDAPGRQYFRNAGSAVHRGVEAGVRWVPLRGVRVRAAYTLTDARFDAYTVDGTAYEGNRLPGVLPHRLEAVATYTAPAGWFATLEGRRAAAMYVDDANAHRSPAYTVLDLRLGVDGLALGALRTDAFVGVENVLDVAYNTSVAINAYGGRFYEPGPGRTVYVGASFAIEPLR